MDSLETNSASRETPLQSASPVPPTERDRENAHMRETVAARQEAEYAECYCWALGAFGPGWIPSHRHYLVDKDDEERARGTGEKAAAAATVFTVRAKTGEKRHFTIEGGRVCEHAGYEEAFGLMLLEPHPTRGFEHKGQWCRTHR